MWDLWWTKWHSDRLFSKHFGLPLSVSLHHCSIPIFFLILLLAEGQADEAREPSHRPKVLGKRKKQLNLRMVKLALRLYRRRFKH
jgi:hypothetical protein